MLLLPLFKYYFIWHYTSAFQEILHVYRNLNWFTVHFFSIPDLARSLFLPWKRLTQERGQTFNFEDIAGYLIINFISRFIGFLLRFFLIAAGLSALLILLSGLIITFVLWVTAPVVLVGSLYFGVITLLTL